ncbi:MULTISPECIES: hypothetical protein [Niallia]|jgi:hypothetical protein|nr:hypothetical protein [Niallia circulans]
MTLKRKQIHNPNRRHMSVPAMHFSVSIYNKQALAILEAIEKSKR